MTTNKAVEFLEKHQSSTPSHFEEEARWRLENDRWLRMARRVSLSLIDYMQDNNLSRAQIANKLGISQQYLSRILSGTENLSLKSLAKIEIALGITLFSSEFTIFGE